MPLIPEDLIDDIQHRSDIAELIGRYVPLKRAGRHLKGLCPFHTEKTPSFMVNTDKQIYHCFGCGAGGNIFSFLIAHDRLTFPEAVHQLADHVGVQLPERGSASDDGAQERLAALMEQVCQYFERLLAAAQGSSARAYLKQRGVSEATRQAFRLGVAPAGWSYLLTSAKRRGVTPEQLEAAGLVIKGKSGYYDRFRQRLIFPILDVRGRVVGFGGRSLADQEPKYLNSPETALYTKGRHLFGLAQAKDAIVKSKTAVIVEGYFDCVVLAGAGVTNVVSPLGTALTIEQARLVKRYAERVILAFDPDAAGEQATLRGVDLLVEVGLSVSVARLPDGIDPDECLRSLGRERFEQLLSESVSLFDFLVETAVKRYPGRTTEEKVNAAQFILPTIAKVPNAMLRSEYIQLLAQRLRLDETAVAQELAKIQPRAAAPRSTAARQTATTPRTAVRGQGPERLLSALVVDEPTRWQGLIDRISPEEIAEPSLRRVLDVVGELHNAGQRATPAQVVSRLTNEGLGGLVSELVAMAQIISSKDHAFDDCLRRIEAQAKKRRLELLREQLQLAQDAGAQDDVRRLVAEYQVHVKGG